MRLIDADELKRSISQNNKIPRIFQQVINSQPTAYSVDKVVEELKELKAYAIYEDMNADIKWIDNAIEIVKQGVISDDVCEWRKSKDYPYDWLVGCDGCEVNHRQGDYCPRCGKKIKIVGD